jgi:hypothetical protein
MPEISLRPYQSKLICQSDAARGITVVSEATKPNPPRKCIFCGGGPISKEHVWAKWMRDYLSPGRGVQYIHEAKLDGDSIRISIRTRPGPLDRKGDMRSQKLRVVCCACNNGWMSAIQSQTKPVLLPFLRKERNELSPSQQEALATWATMFTMIYETTIPDHAATSSAQRGMFLRDRSPPEYWMYWCAPFDGRSTPAIQTGFRSSDRKPAAEGEATSRIHKASVTLCGAGGISLAVLAVSSRQAHENFGVFITTLIERAGYVKLWPTTAPIRVDDRRLVALSFGDLGAIRDALYASLRRAVYLQS